MLTLECKSTTYVPFPYVHLRKSDLLFMVANLAVIVHDTNDLYDLRICSCLLAATLISFKNGFTPFQNL